MDTPEIKRKVKVLMDYFGTTKQKLGFVLGGSKKEDNGVSISRAVQFFKKQRITVEELRLLADFFNKPIEYFLYDEYVSRPDLEILKNAKKVDISDFIDVPFFGSISCGALAEGIPPTDEFRPILKKNLIPGKKYVVLQASGFSMIGAGVQEGDEVLVCLDCEARNGDICIFEFRDEMVMGYYFNDGKFIEIRKANNNYPPIPVDNEDFRIVGIVVSSFRTFRRLI